MTTWILLRGLMRERRHWGDFPRLLQEALPDAAIVTPDLPGNGERNGMRSAGSVAGMVEFCRQDVAARGHAGPLHLLALSLGAMVAVEWAARYPHEIAGAVLMNTSMRPFSRFYRRLRWQNYGAIVAALALGGIARQEKLILCLTSRDAAGREELLQSWIGYQRRYPVARANALRQLLSAARYRAPAQRPAPPILVLAGGGDRLVDPRCSWQLAQRWQTEYHCHPSAGHDLPLDEGAWVARMVSQWSGAAPGMGRRDQQ
ncbi:MAG TPA: alpha/beta hydrolase [Janthinobacterium sp.]|nr:alpha/beta hydrolase [Janthinobacterium sp.]